MHFLRSTTLHESSIGPITRVLTHLNWKQELGWLRQDISLLSMQVDRYDLMLV